MFETQGGHAESSPRPSEEGVSFYHVLQPLVHSVVLAGCVVLVDGRLGCGCFLSFVFLGGARRLGLSPCNTLTSAGNRDCLEVYGVLHCVEPALSRGAQYNAVVTS